LIKHKKFKAITNNVRNFLTLLILFFTLALLGQRRPNAEPEWTATWITLGDADTEAAGM
jgi:hypothetical protein